MAESSFLDQLRDRFGDGVSGANLEALDPWIEVRPDALVEVCRHLRDEPALKFDFLNCITGVDYFVADEKKAAKAGSSRISRPSITCTA